MIRRLLLIACLALGVVACGNSGGTATGTTNTTASSRVVGSITVSAAASLTEAFTKIGEDFEAANAGTSVKFTFDSSTTLAQQIVEGAPVDNFASADQANMIKLADAGKVIGTPVVIATNSLVIVTKPGNPTSIQSVADLVDAGVVSLCGETVPCGRFAQQVLDKAAVTIPEDQITRGQNVKTTISAVSEGDAVAGIVYVTDAAAAGAAVSTVTIPTEINAVATYPMAVVTSTMNEPLAQAFLAYVAGPEAQAVLRDAGFASP